MTKLARNSFVIFLLLAFAYAFWGLNQGWNKLAIILPLIVVTVGFNLIIENWIPFHTDKPSRPYGKDTLFTFFNIFVTAGIGDILVTLLLAKFFETYMTGKTLFQSSDLGPLWLQVIAAILLNEFIRYWVHFLQHKIPGLWRLHAIHHSVKEIYSLNTFFSHPFDYFLRNSLAFPLILFAGFDPTSVVVASTFTTVTSVFSHSRANFDFGWLNYLFSTNHLHRWHHSTIPAEADKNFGVGLIVWDLAFGTYYLPRDRKAPQETGLHADHPYAPNSFVKVLIFPFFR